MHLNVCQLPEKLQKWKDVLQLGVVDANEVYTVFYVTSSEVSLLTCGVLDDMYYFGQRQEFIFSLLSAVDV
jgi:hypothetical protein